MIGAYLNALVAMGLDFGILTPEDQPADADGKDATPGWIPVRVRLRDYPQLKRLAWLIHGAQPGCQRSPKIPASHSSLTCRAPLLMRIRIILLALLATALFAGCGREPKLTPVSPGATVLAFGDSVTFGTGAAPGEDWPTALALRTGWQVINAGVPGDTAESGKSRLADLLEQHQPALVIIEIGGNDFLRRRPQPAVKEDVRHLLRTVRQSGAQVVLVAVPEVSLLNFVMGKGDAPLYQELAEEEAVPLIDRVFAETLSRPELRADQIHPNAEGYRHMASGIYDYLKQAGAI